MTAAVALTLVGVVALPALGLGGRESLAICHRSQIRGSAPTTWTLLLVGMPAVQAHYDHGDGAPNGQVPGMPGFTFDSTCIPAAAGDGTTTTTTSAPTTTTTTSTTLPGTVGSCFDGAFGTYDLYVGVLDVEDGSALWSSTDGTCSGSEQMTVTVIDGAADRTEARASCALILGGTADQYFPMRAEPLFPEAPSDWWLCF
jgi:hypothetical protein